MAVALAELADSARAALGRGVRQRLDRARGRSRSARRVSLGTAPPTSAHARLDAAHDERGRVESVPSQSKTIRSKRRGRRVMRGMVGKCIGAGAARCRQRRLELHALAARGMRRTASRHACRNMRSKRTRHRFAARQRLVAARSRRTCRRRRSAWPSCARCTRIWCVRPVLMVTSSSVKRRRSCARDRAPSVIARMPVGVVLGHDAARAARRRPAGTCAAARRSPSCSPATRRRPSASVGLAASRARGTGPAARPAPSASSPPAACPRSRGRAGAPAPGTCASGRARRSCSITPKLTPLPPCTATPAGLSMAMQVLVLEQRPGIRAPAPARSASAGSAMRTGGTRTTSPSASRVSARGAALVHPHFAASG